MKIGHPLDKSAAAAAKASPAPAPDAGKANSATANATASATASANASATVSATAIPGKADASAKIALSSEAASLIQGGSSAEFDAEKVARISAAIDDGSFKVNPEVIADKLIANAQELLVKK